MSQAELRLVIGTAPDRACAENIAERLVAEKLAACVQLVGGMTSFYHWEGRLARTEEILILAKTCRPAPCLDRLAALSPYEVPEGLVLPIESGLAPYLDWAMRESGD